MDGVSLHSIYRFCLDRAFPIGEEAKFEKIVLQFETSSALAAKSQFPRQDHSRAVKARVFTGAYAISGFLGSPLQGNGHGATD